MGYVILVMLQFAHGALVIDMGYVSVPIDECRSWIREFEPYPPGKRAYCAVIKPKRNGCWYNDCGINYG